MNRDGKGTKVNRHLTDYCVLDLETTGIFINFAKIVEISAIKVRNNNVVDEFSTLINPQCKIPFSATEVNGITDDMVKDAPIIEDVINDFLTFIGDDVILGYNNAGFDMNIIYDAVADCCNGIFDNNYIDLLHVSRRCLTGVPNYKLQTISEYFSIDTTGEHRALKDCYLTKECYDKIFEEFGEIAFIGKSGSRDFGANYSLEASYIKELQQILKVIIDDDSVTIDEFLNLKIWMEKHFSLKGHYPFDYVYDALDKVLLDGKITSSELDDLQVVFSDFLDSDIDNTDEIIDEENYDNATELFNTDWVKNVNVMFDEIVRDYELPNDSLRFEPNYGKKEPDKIISYSAYIWEPTYPSISNEKSEKNCLIMSFSLSKVRSRPNDLDINIRNTQEISLHNSLPKDAIVVSSVDNGMAKVRIDKNSPNLVNYIRENAIYCIENYESKSSKFGCCSLYEECSNLKRCLHTNKLYSTACMYRKNLENGHVFYGDNIECSEDKNYMEMEQVYSGKPSENEAEKNVRRELGLPVTKQLIYYLDKSDPNSFIDVENFKIIESFEITAKWYMLDVTIKTGDVIRIHSSHFAEMQKPNFVADMAAQSSQI